MSGNVKPGVDPERSDYRTLRAERGTCFNPLQALITSPQQTECTSSFLHLTPIQAKIKTFITVFEKRKRIYGLKVMKSEFNKATGICRIDGELLCVRDAGADGSRRWIFVAVDVDIVDDFFSLITFYGCFSFGTFTLSITNSCILANMQQ